MVIGTAVMLIGALILGLFRSDWKVLESHHWPADTWIYAIVIICWGLAIILTSTLSNGSLISESAPLLGVFCGCSLVLVGFEIYACIKVHEIHEAAYYDPKYSVVVDVHQLDFLEIAFISCIVIVTIQAICGLVGGAMLYAYRVLKPRQESSESVELYSPYYPSYGPGPFAQSPYNPYFQTHGPVSPPLSG